MEAEFNFFLSFGNFKMKLTRISSNDYHTKFNNITTSWVHLPAGDVFVRKYFISKCILFQRKKSFNYTSYDFCVTQFSNTQRDKFDSLKLTLQIFRLCVRVCDLVSFIIMQNTDAEVSASNQQLQLRLGLCCVFF